jgi:hypothetical protein
MEISAKVPMLLPWLAKRFDVPESVANQMWQVVVRDADAHFRPEERGSSEYWASVMRAFRESLAHVQQAPLLGVLHCHEQVVFASYAAGIALLARPWTVLAGAGTQPKRAA